MDGTNFGAVVKELRQATGLSQEELAFKAGLHRTYISQLERGEKSPSLKTLERLAKALGLKASDILIEAEKKRSR